MNRRSVYDNPSRYQHAPRMLRDACFDPNGQAVWVYNRPSLARRLFRAVIRIGGALILIALYLLWIVHGWRDFPII